MYFTEDEYFARQLQNEINAIQSVQLQSPRKEKENTNPIDSKLELIDPTPSIHDLFVKFDKKFFWSSLGMVQVKWSNRMTKCAGMCCFEGKRGLCNISLSAPLLSLRPRKDLVETLLHEMIHAYLFVTNNYRDRDDHGPQFHKHMDRINKEAGTKITVYHSFFSEVKYYQKHVWRCNGPCQNKKPYFGFLRRAMNRAPGPNDTWWNEHQMECNGTFIKISEPEGKPKKKRKIKIPPKRKTKDIRNFFTPSIVATNSNIKTIADLKVNQPVLGVKSNNAGTLVVTKSEDKNLRTEAKNLVNSKKVLIKEKSYHKDVDSEKIRETVRNVWANKFSAAELTKKQKLQCPVCEEGFSEQEIETHVENCLQKNDNPEDMSINSDPTSSKSDDNFKKCPVCSENVLQFKMDEHLESCLNCSFVNEKESEDDEVVCQSIPCPCCYQWFLEEEINGHIDECLTVNILKEEMAS